MRCDSTLAASPTSTTNFQCNMLDPYLAKQLGGGVISVRCDLFKGNNGTNQCAVDIWHVQSGPPLIFSCSLYSCWHRFASQSALSEFHCATSNCSCGSQWQCSTPLQAIIVGLVSGMSFQCDSSSGACTLLQPDLELEAKLQCSAGDCVPVAFASPRPVYWTTERLVVLGLELGLAAVVVAVLGCAALFAARRRRFAALLAECEETTRTQSLHELASGAGAGAAQYSLGFADLSFRVGSRPVLRDCRGLCQAGTVTAIMGASGAGKTTLLHLLAGRAGHGAVTGRVLLNGRPRDAAFKRIAAFVQQEDYLIPTLTVRETLMYSAELRLPQAMPMREKVCRVLGVLRQLGLEHVADMRVGDREVRGISGGERRRVSIGCELVTAPRVLFLDEPTSGLDASTAHAITACLAALARRDGLTVIMTIHQPRSSIFRLFDALVLLARGHMLYNGPAAEAVAHFGALLTPCPAEFNPADYLIDAVAGLSEDRVRHLAALYADSPAARSLDAAQAGGSSAAHAGNPAPGFRLNDDVDGYTPEADGAALPASSSSSRLGWVPSRAGAGAVGQASGAYASGFYHQFWVLSRRTARNVLRSPSLGLAHMLLSVLVAVLIGSVYYHVNDEWSGLQNRAGCLFFVISLLAFASLSSLELFIAERALFMHERANGCYRTSAYYLAKVACDLIPLRVVPPLVLGTIMYVMVGLKPGVLPFAWFLLVLVLVNVTAAGICMCVGAVAPNVGVANLVTVLVMLFFMLFGGFLVNNDSIGVLFVWFKRLSFFNYAFEALMVSQLEGHMTSLAIEKTDQVPISGSLALRTLALNPDNFNRDVTVLCGMACGYLVLAYALIRLRYWWYRRGSAVVRDLVRRAWTRRSGAAALALE